MTTAIGAVTVEDADALAGLTYDWEAASARDASPAIGPAWLRATDGIDARMPPTQYVLIRSGQDHLAALPMHVATAPVPPDADPRSYFGGTTDTPSQEVCCGSRETSPAAGILTRLKDTDVFPALILGSLPGYRSEILHTHWTPQLAASLIDAAIAYARAQDIATIVAPWVADHGSGKALARELERRGAVASYWAEEDYLPLRHDSLQAHLAAARSRDRYRYRQDMQSAAAIGLTVRALSTGELRGNLGQIGTMVAANRRRYGYDITETHAPLVLTRLLELGVPLLTVGGFQHDRLVACCVSLEKAGRVYAKYAGFDYGTLGTRSGAYFAVVMYGTIAAAHSRKARVIEFGVGAHQAKALRGCRSRTITSYLLTGKQHIRDAFAAAAAANTPHRRAEYAAT